MSSELPPELIKHLGQDPKSEFDEKDLADVRKITANPVGVPVNHTQIDAERPVETHGTEVRGLPSERAWFFLGFAYEFLGLDVELFEVFIAAHGKLSRDVQNVVVPKMFFDRKDGVDKPLMHLVQGIPREQGQLFIDFMTTYRFVRPARTVSGKVVPSQDMCCNFQEVRMADPTLDTRRAVEIWFALPANLTANRHVAMLKAPGFLLDRPLFGITPMPKEPNAKPG